MASIPGDAEHARTMGEDLHVKGILVAALSIAVAIGFALGAAFAVIHLGNGGAPAPSLAAYFGKPPSIEGGVVLQPNPAQDIRAFTAEKRRLLDGYAWIDREHGIARIPIDRAMALVVDGALERKP